MKNIQLKNEWQNDKGRIRGSVTWAKMLALFPDKFKFKIRSRMEIAKKGQQKLPFEAHFE